MPLCLICPCSQNWIWGGLMNNKCFYLVEGACERQLINALKAEPSRLILWSIIVHNVVQKTIRTPDRAAECLVHSKRNRQSQRFLFEWYPMPGMQNSLSRSDCTRYIAPPCPDNRIRMVQSFPGHRAKRKAYRLSMSRNSSAGFGPQDALPMPDCA